MSPAGRNALPGSGRFDLRGVAAMGVEETLRDLDGIRRLPAETGLTEVSVVAVSATEAEIVAKAALLLGPDIAPTYCAAHAFAWQLEP